MRQILKKRKEEEKLMMKNIFKADYKIFCLFIYSIE